MKRVLDILLCPLVLFITSGTATILAQAPTVKVEPVKQLRKGVDAWPLIVNPANPAEQRVNATLTRLNLRLSKALSDCDVSVLESMRGSGKPQNELSAAAAEDWSRKVVVTMQGPRFLSLLATDEYVNCGGAHPDSDMMAMVFDLTTGTPMNWPTMVAKSAGASAILGPVSDGSRVGALVLPALAKIHLAAANEDCKEAFQDPQPFQLWPDAKSGTLVAQAFGLPHVVAACAVELPLSMEQARTLGFDESVLGAIEQAHREIAATPKP